MSIAVDNNTSASNPGNVRLKPIVWVKHNLQRIAILTSVLLIAIFLTIAYSWWFIVLLVVLLVINIFYWVRTKEHFAHGDSNGGVVASLDPVLIAVKTDLTKGYGAYPVVKIIEYKTSKSVKVGDKIATVALYQASEDENLPHWIDFNPVPVSYATNNNKEIDRALASYTEDQWNELESGLEQVPKPLSPGLYRINLTRSDWR